jgi:2-desacetyl-2-hydroxyethyl bacteriochlorophyllide A dehydrogenase
MKMKAMMLKASRKLQLEEVKQPALMGDRALVRVTHSGICGTDLKIYSGGIPVQYPLIMGHEMCGELAEGGDGRYRPGTRVIIDPCLFCATCYCCHAGGTGLCPHGGLIGRDANGGFADYLISPSNAIFPLPDTINSRQAPLIQVATTCLHAQRRAEIFPGQSVVVLGLGVAGQIHVQMAKARGAYPVIGITRSAWKRSLAEKLGADATLPGGPAAEKAVLEATHGQGADVVIESTGKLPVMASALNMARPGGKILLFGITTATEGALPFYQFYFKELTLINARAAKNEDFPATIDLVARGLLNLDALITHVLPLSELDSALGLLDSDADERMKIIIDNSL